MIPSAERPWQLELNGQECPVVSPRDLADQLTKAQQLDQGRLVLSAVTRPAPLWKRAFGTKYVSRGFFAVEWFGQVASLIFLDDDWSEYRAIDSSAPVKASEDERSQVAHGEVTPPPQDECMSKERAFQAIAESIEASDRPNWLHYRVVR